MSAPSKYSPFHFFTKNEEDEGIIRWIKSLSLLSFLISLIVFTDYFLPLKEEKQIIEKRIARTNFEDIPYDEYLKFNVPTGEDEFWIITNRDEIAVQEKIISELKDKEVLMVYKTSVFGLNVKMKNEKSKDGLFFYPYLNAYGFLIIFPILFVLIFILNLLFKNKTELILSLGVINLILLVGFGFLLLFY